MSTQALLGALGAGAPPPQGPVPGGLPQGPDGGSGVSEEQAVWDQFPGTDPNVVTQLLQAHNGSIEEALGPLFMLFSHDEEMLDQKHQAALQAFIQALSAPSEQGGPPQAGPGPGPAVGGENTGGP